MAEGEALVTCLGEKFSVNTLLFNEKKWRDPLIWITPWAGYPPIGRRGVGGSQARTEPSAPPGNYAASGFASFSIATVKRAFTGAKALSASFTEAS